MSDQAKPFSKMTDQADQIKTVCEALGWYYSILPRPEVVNADGYVMYPDVPAHLSHFLILATCEVARRDMRLEDSYDYKKRSKYIVFWEHQPGDYVTNTYYYDSTDPDSYQAAWLSALAQAAGWIKKEGE